MQSRHWIRWDGIFTDLIYFAEGESPNTTVTDLPNNRHRPIHVQHNIIVDTARRFFCYSLPPILNAGPFWIHNNYYYDDSVH